MTEFINPFLNNDQEPLCDDNICTPCADIPSPEQCFMCGYDHNAYESCRNQATPCLDGSVNCLDCESSFSDIKFLGGYVAGYSSKLGYGPSESSITIDLVVLKHNNCVTTNSDCGSTPICTDDVYTGHIGHIYTFNIGGFCFRGILTNHNYTEDNSGYKYKVTLTDGRSILGGCSVLLNGIYGHVPDIMQHNLINILYDAEPSVDNDICGILNKCTDFMKSGADKKGIYLNKALEKLNGKCIIVPVSGAALKLNLDILLSVINNESRTTNQESTILELIDLACEESGLSFFAKINNDNEIEIFPIDYKIDPSGVDLFNFVENLNNNDIVISKDYGQEMSFEKGKRIVFGADYCYLTLVQDKLNKYDDPYATVAPLASYDCYIEGAPWQQPDVRSDHPDGPVVVVQP